MVLIKRGFAYWSVVGGRNVFISEKTLSLAVMVLIKRGFAYWSVVGGRNVFISCKQRSGQGRR